MKKLTKVFLSMVFAGAMLTGCGSSSATITAVTREEGSGTRGAFVELFGLEDADGNETISQDTQTTNSTAVMITTVQGNENAIGYISLGSLNDDVKAVQIDGVDATAENIMNGTYKISRPFNIVTRTGDTDPITQDFITYILSDEGQAVVTEEGYISEGSNGAYTAANLSGSITVGGSSSVTPVMEKLAEAYKALNPNVSITVQQTDSTSGVTGATEGLLNIGMVSREVTSEELAGGLTSQSIALDGIAVIVNTANDVENLTSDQVKQIYTKELTSWDEVK
ncbi:MAG TPA: substrate-binding domain-containing protein [Candidatus Fimiplasma intestinipullorum]|uniref:Substrate-binding domain-containing protein n=1 Tax=Candidatus Fimiplasma intestinipullorum TaxID=2840825 RepID=A0A9D1KZM5_9FIRM|nr:substrate-binding domain-containing protein [Candidatus Fimiplasma intestinipullorum]